MIPTMTPTAVTMFATVALILYAIWRANRKR